MGGDDGCYGCLDGEDGGSKYVGDSEDSLNGPITQNMSLGKIWRFVLKSIDGKMEWLISSSGGGSGPFS